MANRVASGRRRGGPGWLLLVPVVLALGWCAVWAYARHEAERSLDGWIAAEQRAGRVWTCPARRIDGFPGRIGLTCTEPTFTQVSDPGTIGRVASLRAEAALGSGATVSVSLAGPLRIGPPAGPPAFEVTWRSAEVVLDGVAPGSFDRARLDAADVAVATAGSSPIGLDQGTLVLHPLAQGDGRAELTVDLAGLRAPALDALSGIPDPASLGGTATITHLPSWGATLPTLLESWRAAGGTLDLTRLALAKGGLALTATGRLGLDAAHRVEGRLDSRVTGLAPVAAHLGMPVETVKVAGLLAGLLGGKADPQPGLPLPLTARDGHVFFGPVKSAIALPPLY